MAEVELILESRYASADLYRTASEEAVRAFQGFLLAHPDGSGLDEFIAEASQLRSEYRDMERRVAFLEGRESVSAHPERTDP